MLGKTFTAAGLAALTGMPEDELEPLLDSLVRKEVLGVQADPRSPERGQYGFVQDARAAGRLRHALAQASARRVTSPPPRTSSRAGAPTSEEIVEVDRRALPRRLRGRPGRGGRRRAPGDARASCSPGPGDARLARRGRARRSATSSRRPSSRTSRPKQARAARAGGDGRGRRRPRRRRHSPA